TTIRVWLPLTDEPPLTPEVDDHWPAGRRVSGRVLLVEDDDDLLGMARDALESIGLDVTCSPTAEAALKGLSRDGDFDAVVTDVILPGMSGVELVNAARRLHPTLPAIYMTGYAGARSIPAAPGDPVIRKPYTPDTLRLRVAEVVA